MTGSTAVSLIVIIHTKRFLPSNSQISLVFPTFCSFKEWKKSDFCGHQFGVQKPQQKPVSPQRASPVQEHVRTYMLAGRGEQLVVALQNHGNPAVCKTCRVPAETIETCTIFCPAAKLWSPSEKKHKFRLFLHVRDRSFPYRWVSRALQRREYLFSTPCEHLCPHMFLNWGGPPWRHRFC